MYQSLFHKDRESTLDIPSRGGYFFFLHLKKLLIFSFAKYQNESATGIQLCKV